MSGFSLSQLTQMWVRENVRALSPGSRKKRREWLEAPRLSTTPGAPSVVFDFPDCRIDGPQGRRIHTLVIYFLRTGYDVWITLHPRFASNLDVKLKRLLLNLPLRFIPSLKDAPRGHLLLTDRELRKLPDGVRKAVVIDYGRYVPGTPRTLPLPFPMHPWTYQRGLDLKLDEYRRQERRIRLFFMGEVWDKYSTHEVKSRYGMIPRDHLIDMVCETLGPDRVRRLRTLDEWRQTCRDGFDGFAWAATADFKIPPEEWLASIASAHAFLVCPGVHYPMSHHAVEAMAVGSIPLLQYHHLFHPQIGHDVSLRYDDREGLLKQLKLLFAMDAAALHNLQIGAAAHYDAHLTPQRFTAQLEAAQGDIIRLFVLAHQSPAAGSRQAVASEPN